MNQAEPRSRFRESVLISPSASAELVDALIKRELNVARWPKAQIGPPNSFESLNQAIENIFGYDWVIFINEIAALSFLDRFVSLEREIKELDSKSVCAIGDSAATALESHQVHVDVMTRQYDATRAVEDVAGYLGGRDNLARQNFLIPDASGGAFLQSALEAAGARADVVASYETVSRAEALRLVSLQTILLNGGIDCVIFNCPADFKEFAAVFDTLAVSPLLAGAAVVCTDEETARLARQFAVSAAVMKRNNFSEIAEAVATHLAVPDSLTERRSKSRVC